MIISRSLQKTQYVKAGNQLAQAGRIQVSSHVYLFNEGENDGRTAFRAHETTQFAPRGVALKWASLALVVAMLFSVWMVGHKMALTQELNQAYDVLCNRYAAAEAEGRALAQAFAEKSDASKICYYAVQNLGMRLATHEETIGVTVQASTALSPLDAARLGYAAHGQ
ncbi:MAG: hypothetical protein ACOX6Y_09140 [Christensenellales bacterium]